MTEFKSRKELEVVAAQLASSPELQRETAKKIDGVVVITVVKKKGGDEKEKDVWVLDAREGKASLKRGGGEPQEKVDEVKPVVSVTSDDASVVRLVRGRASAQALFLRGKLALRGDLSKARHVESVLALRGKL